MKTLDRILRDGTSAEFCALYEAIGRLYHDERSYRVSDYVEEIKSLYEACEAVSEEFDALVEEYKESDGTPSEMEYGMIVPK